MSDIHDFENHDFSHISSKNDLLLKDIDNMINKLNEKRRNSSSNFRNSKKFSNSSKLYNKDKSPKLKSSYNFTPTNDYNSYHQKFHEYSIRNKEQQKNMFHTKNYYKKNGILNNHIVNMKIPFYPKNNNNFNYDIKDNLTFYDYDNKFSQYDKPNYYNTDDSIYDNNNLNTEYSQDNYPLFLSEPNKFDTNYNDIGDSNYNYENYYSYNSNNYYDIDEKNISNVNGNYYQYQTNKIYGDKNNVNNYPNNISTSSNIFNNGPYKHRTNYTSLNTNDINIDISTNSNSISTLNNKEINEKITLNSDELNSNNTNEEIYNHNDKDDIKVERILINTNLYNASKKMKNQVNQFSENNNKYYFNNSSNHNNNVDQSSIKDDSYCYNSNVNKNIIKTDLNKSDDKISNNLNSNYNSLNKYEKMNSIYYPNEGNHNKNKKKSVKSKISNKSEYISELEKNSNSNNNNFKIHERIISEIASDSNSDFQEHSFIKKLSKNLNEENNNYSESYDNEFDKKNDIHNNSNTKSDEIDYLNNNNYLSSHHHELNKINNNNNNNSASSSSINIDINSENNSILNQSQKNISSENNNSNKIINKNDNNSNNNNNLHYDLSSDDSQNNLMKNIGGNNSSNINEKYQKLNHESNIKNKNSINSPLNSNIERNTSKNSKKKKNEMKLKMNNNDDKIEAILSNEDISMTINEDLLDKLEISNDEININNIKIDNGISHTDNNILDKSNYTDNNNKNKINDSINADIDNNYNYKDPDSNEKITSLSYRNNNSIPTNNFDINLDNNRIMITNSNSQKNYIDSNQQNEKSNKNEHNNISLKIINNDETTSIVLNETSLENSYFELDNEKIRKPNQYDSILPKNSPKEKKDISISEITNTEFLNETSNIDALKRHTLPKKKDSLFHQFNTIGKPKRIVSIKNKDSINSNLNYLKTLFNSKSFNIKIGIKNNINDNNNNIEKTVIDDECIYKNENSDSSNILKQKRQQKLLNENNQQNILNAFTKVNEFKNKIITKKYILNEKEIVMINPEEKITESQNIAVKEDITKIIDSPISFDNENKKEKIINNPNNTTNPEKENIPLKINILKLKKPELSKNEKEKEELFLDSLEIITDILRSSLHNIQSEEWKIFDNKEFTNDHRLIVIKKIISIREKRINEIKTLKNCFDIDCNLNKCKEIIKKILKNKKMDKYTVGELGMTLANIIRFYPQNFISILLFKTYFSVTFGNYDNLSIFDSFNEKEREIWDKLISHFSKILKQSNTSSWSFYLSNIIGWVLTPRTLINTGDPISRNQIGRDLEKINQIKFTEDITLELKELLFCRSIKMVYNIFNFCTNTEEIKINSKALLYAFISENDCLYLMKEAIIQEIINCDDINKLFMVESTASNLLTEYLRLEGKGYLENFIGITIKYLLKKNTLYEIDMYKETSKAKIKKGYKNFTILINESFNHLRCIFNTIPL